MAFCDIVMAWVTFMSLAGLGRATFGESRHVHIRIHEPHIIHRVPHRRPPVPGFRDCCRPHHGHHGSVGGQFAFLGHVGTVGHNIGHELEPGVGFDHHNYAGSTSLLGAHGNLEDLAGSGNDYGAVHQNYIGDYSAGHQYNFNNNGGYQGGFNGQQNYLANGGFSGNHPWWNSGQSGQYEGYSGHSVDFNNCYGNQGSLNHGQWNIPGYQNNWRFSSPGGSGWKGYARKRNNH